MNAAAVWRPLAILALSFIVVDKLGLLPTLSTVLADADSRALTDAHHESLVDVVNASGSHGDEAEHQEHSHHPHEAMFFLIGAIMIGTSVLHLTRLPCFSGLQQTVVLFVLGCGCSLLFEGLNLEEHLGGVGRSYSMWMIIDPHLLLFALLPPLLAGDAMTIDTNVASKVAWQCIYLAVPGVLVNAFLTALFLWVYLPYEWPFLLCLTAGTILCATDPVAVVALLKELGASPVLTVQIQGESLLNDGTAIVLYSLCYGRLGGKTYTNEDIVIFLAKTAVYAWILGMFVGELFFQWIRAAKNKFDHNSGMIQVSLTICCAYFSFVFAEGVLHISGVLATVASSLVLAHKMWPEIVSNDMMLTIWHTFEYLGNTVIFFLAGALTGNIMLRTPLMDYVHLLAIYAMLVLIRTVMIFASRPLLRFCSATRRPVSLADAAVMSWGGLRGAVGLALAIQVTIDRADGELRTNDADRVLFYVGGIALLTLVINATTCPILVRRLGITQLPEAKIQLMCNIHKQMMNHAAKQAKDHKLDLNTQSCVQDVFTEMQSHLRCHDKPLDPRGESFSWALTRISSTKSPRTLVEDHQKAAETFMEKPLKLREQLLAMLPPSLLEDKEEKYSPAFPCMEPTRARMMNETFLKLVKDEYEQQNRRGELSTGQACALLSSVASALSSPVYNLRDLGCLLTDQTESSQLRQHMRGSTSTEQLEESRPHSWVHHVVEAPTFIIFITVCILVNMIFVMLDYYLRPPGQGDSGNLFWFLIEVLFTVIFTGEAALRIADEKLAFFLSVWNLFDFVLVLAGLAGIGLHLAFLEQQSSFGAKEAQLMRIIRVFKALRVLRFVRFMRIVRTVRAKWHGRPICLVTSERLQRFELFLSYVKAHRGGQRKLLECLGRNDATMRVLLQSETLVYKAMTSCTEEMQYLSEWLLEELRTCLANLRALQDLEDYLLRLRASGVLNDNEAETLVHPVHHHMRSNAEQLANTRHGCAQQPRFSSRERAVRSDSHTVDWSTFTTEVTDPAAQGDRGFVHVESSLGYSSAASASSRPPLFSEKREGGQDEERDTSSTRSSGDYPLSPPPSSSPQPSHLHSSPAQSKSSTERSELSPTVRPRGPQHEALASPQRRTAVDKETVLLSEKEVVLELAAIGSRGGHQREREDEDAEMEEEVRAQMPGPTTFGRPQDEDDIEEEEDLDVQSPAAGANHGQASSSRAWHQPEVQAKAEAEAEDCEAEEARDDEDMQPPRPVGQASSSSSMSRGGRQAPEEAEAEAEAQDDEDLEWQPPRPVGQQSLSTSRGSRHAQAPAQVEMEAHAHGNDDLQREPPRPVSQPSRSRSGRHVQAQAQVEMEAQSQEDEKLQLQPPRPAGQQSRSRSRRQAQAEWQEDDEAQAQDDYEMGLQSPYAGQPSSSRGLPAQAQAQDDYEMGLQSPQAGRLSSSRGLPAQAQPQGDYEMGLQSPYAAQPSSSRSRRQTHAQAQDDAEALEHLQSPSSSKGRRQAEVQPHVEGLRSARASSRGSRHAQAQAQARENDEALDGMRSPHGGQLSTSNGPPAAGQTSPSRARHPAQAVEHPQSPAAGQAYSSRGRARAQAREVDEAMGLESPRVGQPSSRSRRHAQDDEALGLESPRAGQPSSRSRRRAQDDEARHPGHRRGTKSAAYLDEPPASSRARTSRTPEPTHWEAAGPGVWRRSRGPTPKGLRVEEDEQSALEQFV